MLSQLQNNTKNLRAQSLRPLWLLCIEKKKVIYIKMTKIVKLL